MQITKLDLGNVCPPPPRPLAEPRSVEKSISLLLAAKTPLIVIGKGSQYARAEDNIRKLVDKLQCPFLPTPMGKGVVPDRHPLNVSAARSAALAGADVGKLCVAVFR
jgi:2-hydroxyacyl-CoA lyase 1